MRNSLTRLNILLLQQCRLKTHIATTTTVILGVVAVAKSVVEEVEEIHQRLTSALEHIDAHRLVAAPDCGLGLLSRETACRKLHNLCQAAGSIG